MKSTFIVLAILLILGMVQPTTQSILELNEHEHFTPGLGFIPFGAFTGGVTSIVYGPACNNGPESVFCGLVDLYGPCTSSGVALVNGKYEKTSKCFPVYRVTKEFPKGYTTVTSLTVGNTKY